MAKIKAVLDQETWVEVDVPDEFQAIVVSVFCSELLATGNTDDAKGTVEAGYGEGITSSGSLLVVDNGLSNSDQQIEKTDSVEASADNTANFKSSLLVGPSDNKKSDAVSAPIQSNNTNTRESGKASSQALVFRGVGYRMVNWLVFLFYCFLVLFGSFLSIFPLLSPL